MAEKYLEKKTVTSIATSTNDKRLTVKEEGKPTK